MEYRPPALESCAVLRFHDQSHMAPSGSPRMRSKIGRWRAFVRQLLHVRSSSNSLIYSYTMGFRSFYFQVRLP